MTNPVHDNSALSAISVVEAQLHRGLNQRNVLAAGWLNENAFVIERVGDWLECRWDDGELNAHPLFEVPAQIEADAWKAEIENVEPIAPSNDFSCSIDEIPF